MPIVQHDVLRGLASDLLHAAGVPGEDARIIGDHLVDANLVGHDTHGVWQIQGYVEQLADGYVGWDAREVVRESPVLQVFDAHGANGIATLTRATDIVIEKARQSTIGMVGLRDVTHMGRLGAYPPVIAEQGMVGMVWTNTGGLSVAPFGGVDRKLRLAPVSYAVPRRDGPPLMLDMTYSVVAGGKIIQKMVHGQQLPEGWVIDRDGNYVTDPSGWRTPDVAILPLGGLQFGHKGHGMSMMMEMIVGPLTLAGCTDGAGGGGGALLTAIDIEAFTDLDTYKAQVEEYVAWVRSSATIPGSGGVYAPGELEEESRARRLEEGIDVPEPTWADLAGTAAELGVAMPAV